MKKTIIETVSFTDLVPGGQTIGTLSDGRKVFAWGVLPGEVAEVRLTKLKKTYAEAVAINILQPSNERIEPRDNIYLSTSPWQIMREQSEINYKTQLVQEFFRQHNIKIDKPQLVTDENFYHYRNKMEYSLWYSHETNLIQPAFHQRGSHQKIPADSSSIEHDVIWREAQRVIAELNDSGADARNYQSLMIRCNQKGEVRSALFAMGQPHPTMPLLTDSILGYEYSYSPNGFFQINVPVYELALSEMAKYIDTDRVVDMYSGVGTIGLSVARHKHLTLVETDKFAFQELKSNIANANSDTITGVHAKSEEALEYITGDATIIVDPPRAGLDGKVVNHLIEVKPPRIIYLSCNPATQGRDVAKLLSKYRIIDIKAYNFFPRTPHIENLVILDRIA